MGETPSFTGEFVGETHRVLECTQKHPCENQHQKGPICLWVAGEVAENQQRAEQVALFPLGPLPHIQRHNTAMWFAPPWQIPKAPSLTSNRHAETKNIYIWPNERTDQSSRKNTTKQRIASLSDAQFKTLVIRKLTELVEFGHKLDENEG